MQQRATCPFCQTTLADRRQEFCASCHRRVREEYKKRISRLLLRLFILGAISSFLIGLIGNSRAFQGYVQASCTITGHQSVFHRTRYNKNESTYYTALLTYVVSAPPDQRTTAQGYAGPAEKRFDQEGQAETAMATFHVGESYPCWYPKGYIEQAVLVLNTDGFFPWYLAILGAFAFISASPAFVFLALLLQTSEPLYTRGTVIERIQTQKSFLSVVVFPLVSEPEVQCTAILNRDLPLEDSVELEYPPRNPTEAGMAYSSASVNTQRILLSVVIGAAMVLPVIYLVQVIQSLHLF